MQRMRLGPRALHLPRTRPSPAPKRPAPRRASASSAMPTDTRFSRLLGHLLGPAPPLRPWGFVLYRGTYADDAAWRRLLAMLRRRARDELRDELALEWYRTGDADGRLARLAAQAADRDEAALARLDAALDWPVRDDPARFDGASKAAVCAHFRAWAADARGRGDGGDGDPRYRYAVYVDADALASVLDRAPPPPAPDTGGAGYVVLIDSQAEAWDDDGDASQEGQGGEPPVEGCTLYDVGWMKVPADGLVPGVYAAALHPEWFQRVYVRPPAVFLAL